MLCSYALSRNQLTLLLHFSSGFWPMGKRKGLLCFALSCSILAVNFVGSNWCLRSPWTHQGGGLGNLCISFLVFHRRTSKIFYVQTINSNSYVVIFFNDKCLVALLQIASLIWWIVKYSSQNNFTGFPLDYCIKYYKAGFLSKEFFFVNRKQQNRKSVDILDISYVILKIHLCSTILEWCKWPIFHCVQKCSIQTL